MKLTTTFIHDVMVVDACDFEDFRGIFSRLFCKDTLASELKHRHVVQVNYSRTSRVGAVRGMHFQHAPHAEMKMIRCLKGRVWDVAVDLRKGSPTFLQWYAQELSSDNKVMMIIPEGCAHGFQVLEEDSELLYLHTAAYEPSAEGGLRYDDPKLSIEWPVAVEDVSERDQTHSFIKASFEGIRM